MAVNCRSCKQATIACNIVEFFLFGTRTCACTFIFFRRFGCAGRKRQFERTITLAKKVVVAVTNLKILTWPAYTYVHIPTFIFVYTYIQMYICACVAAFVFLVFGSQTQISNIFGTIFNMCTSWPFAA